MEDDPDWIIKLFVIHINALTMEKVEESTLRTIFTSETQSGKLGSESFQEHFEASNDIFWGYNFVALVPHIFFLYSTHIGLSIGVRITSIKVCM